MSRLQGCSTLFYSFPCCDAGQINNSQNPSLAFASESESAVGYKMTPNKWQQLSYYSDVTAAPKLQTLVYDTLPLEEGAGNRCSECPPPHTPSIASVPAPSPKLCQILVTPLFYLRAAVHRRGQAPSERPFGTDKTVEATERPGTHVNMRRIHPG